MEVPAPLLSGSITYLVLTLLACFAGIGMGVTGKMSRENSSYVGRFGPQKSQSASLIMCKCVYYRIFTLLAFMTGLCLWMFWACCWLHQWHILVVPTYGAE
ncbi:Small cysteine rich protein SCR76 [Phytophthora nicotianae]|uniref:Small cysteine rich protein SCR76 n=1 Tax=Phytophthora nicotianae TaxID=4792 RepID=A0A0W8DVC5_PHYNI|nr:Small cysteine rich protein SCR76 [Phytophthora nicotianae]